MKSFAVSKLGVVSTIGSRYMVGPVVTSTMLPSGLAPFTALMPIRPSPPVRFSTTMVRCSTGAISCAISRHSVSPPAPAANGKMILLSPACACASATCASSGSPKTSGHEFAAIHSFPLPARYWLAALEPRGRARQGRHCAVYRPGRLAPAIVLLQKQALRRRSPPRRSQ